MWSDNVTHDTIRQKCIHNQLKVAASKGECKENDLSWFGPVQGRPKNAPSRRGKISKTLERPIMNRVRDVKKDKAVAN